MKHHSQNHGGKERHQQKDQQGNRKNKGGVEKEEAAEKRNGAKTFRRGRAIAFYELMEVKKASLVKQLETLELQTINQILVGELKAIETLMSEYSNLFELNIAEEAPPTDQPETEAGSLDKNPDTNTSNS